MRYEDDFGSYWMVDDAEFVRRRHLARGRPRKFEIPAAVAAAAASIAAAHQHQKQQQFNANRSSTPPQIHRPVAVEKRVLSRSPFSVHDDSNPVAQ